MPPAVAPNLIARLTRRRPRAIRQQEPADLGTAFGMEQWLDERDHAAATTVAQATRRSWWPRWLQTPAAR